MFFKDKSCSKCATSNNEISALKAKLIHAESELKRLSDIIAQQKILMEPHQDQKINELSGQDHHHIELEAKRKKAASAYGYENIHITLREELFPQEINSIEDKAEEFSEVTTQKKILMSEADYERLREKRAALKARLGSAEDQEREDQVETLVEASELKTQSKILMSEADRERLKEKRAALKARLGSAEDQRREEQVETIRLACRKHFTTLSHNLRRSVKYDEYNSIVEDGRISECYRFLKSMGIKLDSLSLPEAISIVTTAVEELIEERGSDGFSAVDHPEDGWEFEHWVAESLQKFGWHARVTQGSGDQGVDVVASKNGLSIGIQCKRYSGSVGNKAVQEAFSGSKYMGLDKAAVLTNADFTRSAKELAASTGVLLLSTDDIPTLHEKI